MGMPQATSTFSIPRRISAFASAKVLPFSRVVIAASSSMCSSSKFFSLKRYCTRSPGGVLRQAGKASAAACTAASTSPTVEIGVRASTSMVAGFVTSTNSVALERRHCPFTLFCNSGAAVRTALLMSFSLCPRPSAIRKLRARSSANSTRGYRGSLPGSLAKFGKVDRRGHRIAPGREIARATRGSGALAQIMQLRTAVLPRAPRQPGHRRKHPAPPKDARGRTDILVLHQKAPLAEQRSPIVFATANQRQILRACIRHVRADIQKVLEEPKTAKRRSRRLALPKEIQAAKQRNQQFTERAAQNHDRLAKPAEEKMSAFVNDQIDEIDEQKIRAVRKSVDQKKCVADQPGDSHHARHRLPLFKAVLEHLHEAKPSKVTSGTAEGDRVAFPLAKWRDRWPVSRLREMRNPWGACGSESSGNPLQAGAEKAASSRRKKPSAAGAIFSRLARYFPKAASAS